MQRRQEQGSKTDTQMSEKENKFVPHSHFAYGKDGSGFYSDHHISCYHANNAAIPLVVDEVQSTDIQSGSAFTIVDYGTADGGTSMPLMYACVKVIREKYGDDLPINIIYEDQPVNDFKSLFMRLQGLIPGPPSYLADFSNVFVTASGTNFYEQCFPSNSINLGFSGTSFHWLSKIPCHLTDSIMLFFNTVSEENEKYRLQAEKDWEQILLCRAAELMPGGKLIVVLLTHDEQLNFKFNTYRLLSKLWKEFTNDGIITKNEFKNTNFIAYGRTMEEIKKPFMCTDSPVIQAGLELVSIEKKMIPCALRQIWLKEKDAKEHAERFVSSMRTWGNSAFTSGLSDTRSKDEKAHIVDELFHRCKAEVIRNPDYYRDDLMSFYIKIQKTK